MIWERFVASQMSAAVFDQTTVDVSAGNYTFRATGSAMHFAGFTRVYEESRDDEKESGKRIVLPELHDADPLDCRKIDPKQHFTEPPPRYTEASLVKALEENGIGRPSTYSTIVETIQARGYVTQQERRFMPTEIGIAVNDLLVEHFPKIVESGFHREHGRRSRQGGRGNGDWVAVLRGFYGPFAGELEAAKKKLPQLELRDEPTDEICPNCGRPMVIKTGRFGKFISCTGYPECKTTKPIVKDTGAKCPKDGGMIVERTLAQGTHVLRLRQLSEVRLRLVGSRRPRTVPGLRRLRRCEDAPRRRPCTSSAPPIKTHDVVGTRGVARTGRICDLERSLTRLTVIGGGLAGCEAAWQAARRGVDVDLYEMRPHRTRSGAPDGRCWPNSSAATRCAAPRSRTRSGCSKKSSRGSIRSSSRRRAKPRCRPAARWPSTASGSAAAVESRYRTTRASHRA